ncbi:hypothetical protein VXQ18_03445 [Brucella abortus]|nr:hypothetical protein [Brucella abortus]
MEALGKAYGFKVSARWSELSEEARQAILYGTKGRKLPSIMTTGCGLIKPRSLSRGDPQSGTPLEGNRFGMVA